MCISAYLNNAVVKSQIGRFNDALELIDKAAKIEIKISGKQSPRYKDILNL